MPRPRRFRAKTIAALAGHDRERVGIRELGGPAREARVENSTSRATRAGRTPIPSGPGMDGRHIKPILGENLEDLALRNGPPAPPVPLPLPVPPSPAARVGRGVPGKL